MNPGSVRLPQKELDLELRAGSYGDQFRRWYTRALEGTLPDDQRTDLLGVIRRETEQTARSAAANWQQALPNRALPPYLKRFAPAQAPSPSGAPSGTASDPMGILGDKP